MPKPVEDISDFIGTIATGAPYSQHQQTYAQNPLWASLGSGAGPHAQTTEAGAQRGIPMSGLLAGGALVEGYEGLERSPFPVGDPRASNPWEQAKAFMSSPMGGATQDPDFYKDQVANLLGAVSGSRMVPEMLKAAIMNKLVPFAQGMSSGGPLGGGQFTQGSGQPFNLDTGQLGTVNQGPQGVTPGNQMIQFFQTLFGGPTGGSTKTGTNQFIRG